jgi:hypothetical protein
MARKQPVEEAYLIQLNEKGDILNDRQAPQKHANSLYSSHISQEP